MSDRQKPVDYLTQYIGIKEGSAEHKAILAVFNDSGLCSRYKMTTSDSWCATAVSAAFIATGLADIFPCVECSCENMVTLAKAAGIWVEDDAYVPSTGDVILYDWDDTGSGDDTGWSDHVGIVVSVSGSTIKVIEGNKSDTVGYRSIAVNGRYIRGFITPKYGSSTGTKTVAELAQEVINGDWGNGADRKTALTDAGYDYDAVQAAVNALLNGSTTTATKTVAELAQEVINGLWGNGADRKTALTDAGYDYDAVQAKVNELLGTGSGSGSSSGSSKPSYTAGGTYTTQVEVNVRKGAGTGYALVGYSGLTADGKSHDSDKDGALDKGTKVTCKATKAVGDDIWMQIPSGWIAAYYDGNVYVK